MNGSVGREETVTRFLLSDNCFAVTTARVKHAAFLPPPSLKLSLFAVRDLDEPAIWAHGYRHVERPGRARTIRARADLLAEAFFAKRLVLEPDAEPPRHLNAVGWPVERERQIAIAHALAHDARLAIDPRRASQM